MNPSRKRILSASASGILLSIFVFAEYSSPRSDWPYIPELPGFIVSMFTVGVHGAMRPFHVVMVIANAAFYGLIVFAGYPLLFHGNDSN